MANSIIGEVVSAKMQKTIVVAVEQKIKHRLYKKIISKTKKYKAHNAEFDIKEGDLVRIASVRPMSKEKHFKVVEIIKK